MHIHSFKEVTDYLPGDDFLHVFECKCGFTIAEKKMAVYSVMRKGEKKE